MIKEISILAVSAILATSAHADMLNPGEVLGRDLLLPGASWAGHVGVSTSRYIKNMSTDVIEVLNEPAVIQTNSIANFKSRSPYWGSRWGALEKYRDSRVTRDDALWLTLWEANRQKAACPTYKMNATWQAGLYDSNGKVKRCAQFRCDTFINYIFHYGGVLLPSYNASIPLITWRAFPYANNDKVAATDTAASSFAEISTEYVAPAPSDLTKHITKFKSDRNIDDIYETQSIYQNNSLRSHDGLKDFYKDIIVSASDKSEVLEVAIRGFTELASESEFMNHTQEIRTALLLVNEHRRTGLLTNIVFTGGEYEKEFINDLVDSLNTTDRHAREIFETQAAHRIKNLGILSLHTDLKLFVTDMSDSTRIY